MRNIFRKSKRINTSHKRSAFNMGRSVDYEYQQSRNTAIAPQRPQKLPHASPSETEVIK